MEGRLLATRYIGMRRSFCGSRGVAAFRCIALAAAAASAPSALAEDPMAAALATIRPEALHAHMAFLADDLLEGRGTATRGHEIAARYVASQFEALGLEPAGMGGAWFPRGPLRRAEIGKGGGGLTFTRRRRLPPPL